MALGTAGPECGAAILAGGRNTRMQGRNKAFLEVDGRTILDRLIETLASIFQEIVLVTRQPELYADNNVRIVEDIFEARSSLTGIHAGLTHARAEYVFMVPCDAPFVQPALVRLLIDAIAPGVEAVVPFLNGYYEPLCAIYAKSCVAPIEAQLNRGDYKITRFFEAIRVQKIPEEKIRSADPRLLSFLNVNTPEAYQALQKMKDNWI